MDEQQAISATRRWIADVVIGLNLCPFAKRVFEADTIRYVVSAAADADVLLNDLAIELETLAVADVADIETTLLIHPFALRDFLDFNDFLGPEDRLIKKLRLRGVVQIAGFHPDYQFSGTDLDAVENYTNRSPFPMLHLLREDSITAVASVPDELLQIPERNIETLRRLGQARIVALLRKATGGGSDANAS